MEENKNNYYDSDTIIKTQLELEEEKYNKKEKEDLDAVFKFVIAVVLVTLCIKSIILFFSDLPFTISINDILKSLGFVYNN